MGFSRIRALSLTELFVQQLENMILSGELAVGQQLPPARELSARMGVSRPVISAGLVELEKLGFVEIRPRQGAFVSDYRRRGTVETLVAIMRYNGGAMRRNEVKSLLETRGALEELCVRLAVENAADAELEALQPILDRLENAPDPEAAAEAVFTFHHELAVLSGNVLLPLLYHSFKPESQYLWALSARQQGVRQLWELKRALYQALLNRDAASAVRQTRAVMDAALANPSLWGQG